MKVTVCFGDVRIIVPCGNGELTVFQLINKAIDRFKRASQKTVQIHCLKTFDDGAILDTEDQIIDICDDRDKLIAVYEEVIGNSLDSCKIYGEKPEQDSSLSAALSDNDSGVAADASNPTSTHTSLNSSSKPPRGMNKNFNQNKNASFRSSISSGSSVSSPEQSRHLLQPVFSRDLNRKSLSTNHPLLYTWIDQQEKFGGGDMYADKMDPNNDTDSETSFDQEISLDHFALKCVDIQPYTTSDGREIGLIVQNVVDGSYVDRVGELQTADRITEVNGIDLTSCSNAKAKEIFNEALKSEVVRIKRTRSHHFVKDQFQLPHLDPSNLQVSKEVLQQSKEAPKLSVASITSQSKEAAIEAVPAKDEEKSSNKHYFIINLSKGKEGLGFSITSKDVLTSNTREFFIKNILNQGAAINDGRLKAGDELLKVNGIALCDKSQSDVVKMLRESEGILTLQLARRKEDLYFDSFNHLPEENLNKKNITPEITINSLSPEETLKLTIPLNSQGSAGLGISVKPKVNQSTKEDLGIYIQSILKGGAAAKDGRLMVKDKLIGINDTLLIGVSNDEAMGLLRNALEKSLEEGSIQIVISRSSKFNYSTNNNEVTLTSSPNNDTLKVSTDHDSVNEDSSLRKPVNMYNPVRNKSFFKACSLSISDENKQFDSGSSAEIQPKPHNNESDQGTHKKKLSLNINPPSYEEAIKRKVTDRTLSCERGKVKMTPESYFAYPIEEKQKQEAKILASFPLSRSKLFSSSQSNINIYEPSRMSIVSQSSLDSVMVGPDKIPFSRDAFGRSSMSERKGRAHIDATKSELYNKLKKFKSMEELRASRLSEMDFNSNFIDTYKLKRVEPLVAPSDELDVLNQANLLNPTAAFGLEGNKKRDVKLDSNRYLKHCKLHSPKSNRTNKTRPYSCIIDDFRNQNKLNVSLQEALDCPDEPFIRKKDESQKKLIPVTPLFLGDEKKRKGFLKGIGGLLKWNKKTKDPVYPIKNHSFHGDTKLNCVKPRPLSMSAESLTQTRSLDINNKNFQPLKVDSLQKILVNEKIQEKKNNKEDTGQQKEKAYNKSNPFDMHNFSYSAYNSTNVTPDKYVAAMREKTKEFYPDGRNSTRSVHSFQLQRQSSLPPRSKKDINAGVNEQKNLTHNELLIRNKFTIAGEKLPSKPISFAHASPVSRLEENKKVPSSNSSDGNVYFLANKNSNSTSVQKMTKLPRGNVSITHQAHI